MTPDRDRPEILTPPQHPQQCCTQQTIWSIPGFMHTWFCVKQRRQVALL